MMKACDMLVLINFIGVAYPTFPAFADKEQAKATAKVWATMLGDIDLNILTVAVQKHTATNKWPPSIAEIRESALSVVQPETTTAAEAWGEVMKAMQNYGTYGVEEAKESMSPLTRKTVEAIGFRTICLAEEKEMGVVRGQFLKMYELMANREKQDALIPDRMKQQIKEIAESKGMKQIGGGK
jgi:hypothetical protein